MSTSTPLDLPASPGQTIGPFFGFALPYDGGNELVAPGTPAAVRLAGRVTDGARHPVPDALLEIWQADPDGMIPQSVGSLRRDGWTFTGFGRAATDGDGRYTFTTFEPGPVRPGAAAFFAVTVFARGVTNRLFTRAYLPDDEQVLAADPLLASLPDDRCRTLIAGRDAHGFRFDVRLQGEDETVFLRFPGH
jgi:protocatechuate 3,4-dioxygenase alpha subunit